MILVMYAKKFLIHGHKDFLWYFLLESYKF